GAAPEAGRELRPARRGGGDAAAVQLANERRFVPRRRPHRAARHPLAHQHATTPGSVTATLGLLAVEPMKMPQSSRFGSLIPSWWAMAFHPSPTPGLVR